MAASIMLTALSASAADGPAPPLGGPFDGPAAGVLPPVAVVPFPAPRRSLPPIGRACVPGFVPDARGICARHDDPRRACAPAGTGGGCVVVPPGPAPYGLGPLLRVDY